VANDASDTTTEKPRERDIAKPKFYGGFSRLALDETTLSEGL